MTTVVAPGPAAAATVDEGAAPIAVPAAAEPSEPALAPMKDRHLVLGVPIDAISRRDALERIFDWAKRRESRVVSICNAHSVVTATREPAFMRVIEASDMATPDGMPVVWMLRHLGAAAQERVAGPDLMWACCEAAQARGDRIFLYGSTPDTLSSLQRRLTEAFPTLRLVGAVSPPFRELSEDEDAAMVRQIEASRAQLVFVGLGCPRQEAWMLAHRGRISAVMIGVGAAFDFHAGSISRAPAWMRASGLEWLHRLASEPRRLWRRYLVTNTLFVWGALRQIVAGSRGDSAGSAKR